MKRLFTRYRLIGVSTMEDTENIVTNLVTLRIVLSCFGPTQTSDNPQLIKMLVERSGHGNHTSWIMHLRTHTRLVHEVNKKHTPLKCAKAEKCTMHEHYFQKH